MLDLVSLGETMVLFAPATTGPLRYAPSFTKHIAGAESNVCIALSKLGHSTGFISAVGADEFGAYVRREIQAEGVDTSQLLTDPIHQTGLMFKQISSGEHTEIFYYRDNSAASNLSFSHIDLDYIANAKILHLSGITPFLSETSHNTVTQLVTFAKKNNLLFSFDPNIRLKLTTPKMAQKVLLPLLTQADIALLGQDEAEILLGTSEPESTIAALRSHGIKTIALKLGSKGSIVADQNTAIVIPPYPTISVDSVGAGDAFNAGFLSGYLQNKPLDLCGKMGNAMGSIAVSVQGDIEGLADKRQLEALVEGISSVVR